MRLAQHVVVGVVGRCHLQTACAKLNVHIAVLNDRDDAVHQRNDDLASLEPLILRVLRVDTHGGIAHDGLGTGGGDNGVVALGILMDDVAFGF